MSGTGELSAMTLVFLANLVTGYKLRTHIAKALQTQSEAIHNALTQYNTEAAKLTPPQSKLSWKEVVEYTFLAEFELLRHSCNDIHHQQWADLAHHEATLQYLHLQQAHEKSSA